MVSRKQYWKNLKPMLKAALSEDAYKEIQADIITRPNYRSMKKAGLRLTGLGDNLLDREESFMTNLLDNVPGIRASERAYTGFLSKLRADMYDDFLKKAQLMGEDISEGSSVTKDLAAVVNNFTGAGRLGKADRSVPILNSLFFSPRKIAATMQILNPANYVSPRVSPTAKREAIKSLLGMVGATSAVLGAAQLLGGEVESNPTSADFAKAKFGNTRIDVSGGNSSYLVLLSRLMRGETTSTITGITKELSSGWGQPSRGDILVKYFRNKLSPTASFVGDWLYGSNAIGKPFKLSSELSSRAMPIIVSSTLETVMEGDTQGAALGAIADFVGFGGATYSANEDWDTKDTIEMKELRAEVGDDRFEEINDEFNEGYTKLINDLQSNPKFLALTNDEKADQVRMDKQDLKRKVMGKKPINRRKKPPLSVGSGKESSSDKLEQFRRLKKFRQLKAR